MARNLGDLVVRIVGDNSGLDSSIDKSKSKLTAFGDSAQRIGGKLSLFVTAPIVGLGIAALKSSADMESMQASFETLLGSAEDAKGLLQELTDLSASTPFQLTDLAAATKTMLAFGIAQEDVLPNLQQLGDIAQGDSEKLKSLTLAFSQIQSTGRLMGQDLLQLINAGFNPLQVISEQTGKSMATLKDEMSKGAISAKDVSDAFRIATSEGGRFYGGMERASQTLNGQLSTLKDNVGILGRSMVESLLPVIKDIVQDLTDLAKRFSNLDDRTKKTIVVMLGLAAGIGPAVTAIGTLSKAFAFLAANPVVAVVAGLVGVVVGINAIASAAKNARIDKLAKEFNDLAVATGVAEEDLRSFADMAGLVEEAFSKTFGTPTLKETEDTVYQVASALELTKEQVILIALRNENITDQHKEQLQILLDQVEEEKNRFDLEKFSGEQMRENVKKAIEAQKIAEERKKLEEQTANAIKEQLEALKAQTFDERLSAWDEYNKDLDDAFTMEQLGLSSSIELVKMRLDAQRQYVEALIESGLTTEEQFNGHIDLLKMLEEQYSILQEAENTQAADEKKNTTDVIALLKKQQAELKKTEDRYKSIASTISGYVAPVLTQIGEQLVQNEFSWSDVARAAVESIAAIVRSLAEQAAVQAAIELAKGNVIGAALWTSASAAGFIASGVISGLAGQIGNDEEPQSAEDNIQQNTDTIPDTAATPEPSTINLSVEIDSDPILQKVFPATQNGTILIDNRAVV